jgi:hypothetical protein
MPYADIEKARAWHRNRARQRRTANRCRRCYAPTTGTAYCFPCAVHRSKVRQAQYKAKKEAA